MYWFPYIDIDGPDIGPDSPDIDSDGPDIDINNIYIDNEGTDGTDIDSDGPDVGPDGPDIDTDDPDVGTVLMILICVVTRYTLYDSDIYSDGTDIDVYNNYK